jgi:hypothetical protein
MTLTAAAQKTRSKGIGSSEIAMLLYTGEDGEQKPMSPWGGRHLLWRRKTGREPEKNEASYMSRGKFMERGLMEWYAHDHGVDWAKPRTRRHPQYPYVVDSCDGLTYPKGQKRKVDPLRCIEAKTATYWKRDEWGEPGTDEVPPYYLVQAMWHLGVHQPQEMICDVPLDNAGMGKRADYHVPYDEELYLALVSQAERFWMDYVEKDVEPPVDDYHETTRWLDRYLKHKTGAGLIDATDEQVQAMLKYRAIALQIKAGNEDLAKLKHELQLAIGEYDGIVITGTKQKILWKQSKDTMGIDWQGVANALLKQMTADGAITDEAFKALCDAHEIVKRKGARKWTPTSLIKNEGAGEDAAQE